jgi:hypothetical protein
VADRTATVRQGERACRSLAKARRELDLLENEAQAGLWDESAAPASRAFHSAASGFQVLCRAVSAVMPPAGQTGTTRGREARDGWGRAG